jgi:hypothetical protein
MQTIHLVPLVIFTLILFGGIFLLVSYFTIGKETNIYMYIGSALIANSLIAILTIYYNVEKDAGYTPKQLFSNWEFLTFVGFVIVSIGVLMYVVWKTTKLCGFKYTLDSDGHCELRDACPTGYTIDKITGDCHLNCLSGQEWNNEANACIAKGCKPNASDCGSQVCNPSSGQCCTGDTLLCKGTSKEKSDACCPKDSCYNDSQGNGICCKICPSSPKKRCCLDGVEKCVEGKGCQVTCGKDIFCSDEYPVCVSIDDLTPTALQNFKKYINSTSTSQFDKSTISTSPTENPNTISVCSKKDNTCIPSVTDIQLFPGKIHHTGSSKSSYYPCFDPVKVPSSGPSSLVLAAGSPNNQATLLNYIQSPSNMGYWCGTGENQREKITVLNYTGCSPEQGFSKCIQNASMPQVKDVLYDSSTNNCAILLDCNSSSKTSSSTTTHDGKKPIPPISSPSSNYTTPCPSVSQNACPLGSYSTGLMCQQTGKGTYTGQIINQSKSWGCDISSTALIGSCSHDSTSNVRYDSQDECKIACQNTWTEPLKTTGVCTMNRLPCTKTPSSISCSPVHSNPQCFASNCRSEFSDVTSNFPVETCCSGASSPALAQGNPDQCTLCGPEFVPDDLMNPGLCMRCPDGYTFNTNSGGWSSSVACCERWGESALCKPWPDLPDRSGITQKYNTLGCSPDSTNPDCILIPK